MQMNLLPQMQNRMVQLMELNLANILKLVGAAVAALWAGLEPMVQLLIVLMALDIITGLLVGLNGKKLDSGIAFKGMLRKALILCVVIMGLVLEYYGRTAIPGLEGVNIPLSEAIAGFFAASEGLSVVENAADAGVPVPKFLRDALAKLSPENRV